MSVRFLAWTAAAVSAIAALGAAGAAPPLADWPTIRRDPANTGCCPAGVAPPLRLLWTAPCTRGNAVLLSAGGRVCVGSPYASRARTRVLDRSGRVILTRAGAMPLRLTRDGLIVIEPDGPEYAIRMIRLPSGATTWSAPAGGVVDGCAGATELAGRLACVYTRHTAPAAGKPAGQSATVLRLIDAATGVPFAETGPPIAGWGEGPAAQGTDAMVFGLSHWLYRLDPNTLQPTRRLYDGGNAWPIRCGSTALVQGWAHGARAVDMDTRKGIWGVSAYRGEAHCIAPLGHGRTVVLESQPSPRAVIGIDARDGRVLWQRALFCDGLSAAAVTPSGPVFYVVGHHIAAPGGKVGRGGLYCLNARTGRVIWRWERPGFQGAAVIADGRGVVVLSLDGRVYRFERARR